MDVIKRAPVRERRIPLKQRVEEGTQLDYTPRLGRPPPLGAHSARSLVLPSPALPPTTTTQPVPARTWLSLRRTTASSCSRPRRGGRNGASIFRGYSRTDRPPRTPWSDAGAGGADHLPRQHGPPVPTTSRDGIVER